MQTSLPGQVTTLDQDSPARQIGCGGKGESRTISAAFPRRSGFDQPFAQADANWMKQQPGYISTQLHQGIAGSTVFMNYALWESVAHFRTAFSHPEFKPALGNYPSSAVASPHLFTRLTVPNLCVGP